MVKFAVIESGNEIKDDHFWHTLDQPLRITNPKAKILPESYICCIDFENAQFKAQESRADWDYHELMKGHDVMITTPKELVQLIETERK